MNRTEHMRSKRKHRRIKITVNSSLALMLLIFIFGVIQVMNQESTNTEALAQQEQSESSLDQSGSPPAGEDEENRDSINKQNNEKPQTDSTSTGSADDTIILAFAGDTMASGKVAPFLEQHGHTYPWEQAKEYFSASDLTMLNLETPVSLGFGEVAEKKYAFLSHPHLLKGAKWAGVDLVTVANNHALDQGQRAFLDTLEYLKEYGIEYVGGGVNAQEAYQRKDKVVNGKKIAFLAFSRVLPSVSWYAGENQPGLASGYQDEKVYELIAAARQEVDLIVVYMHWGKELADEPEAKDRAMAHKMIDAGADVIIGAHSHVLQGMEYYKGKLIAYSLGNFIFTTSHQQVARQSGVLQVIIEGDGTQVARFNPLFIEAGAVWAVDADTRASIIERIASLSSGGRWEGNMFYMTHTNE